jgi:hypothetical protein
MIIEEWKEKVCLLYGLRNVQRNIDKIKIKKIFNEWRRYIKLKCFIFEKKNHFFVNSLMWRLNMDLSNHHNLSKPHFLMGCICHTNRKIEIKFKRDNNFFRLLYTDFQAKRIIPRSNHIWYLNKIIVLTSLFKLWQKMTEKIAKANFHYKKWIIKKIFLVWKQKLQKNLNQNVNEIL